MAKKPTCLVCHKEMERGFMTERSGPAAVQLPRWCPGTPERGAFTAGDAKLGQHENGYAVVAYRCPECEALRLYAPSAQ